MSDPRPEDVRKWLWESYVYERRREMPDSAAERLVDAMARLAQLRNFDEAFRRVDEDWDQVSDDLRKRVGGREGARLRAEHNRQQARAIWSLVTADAIDWAWTGFPINCDQDVSEAVRDRVEIGWQLDRAEEQFPPQHRPAFDRVLVSLPRDTARRLGDALRALTEGEVAPLLAPASSGRRGRAWTRDRLRLRAIEHVLFLVGQGFTKAAARKRVSMATGAPEETLRAWEERDLPRVDPVNSGVRMDLAQRAGEYAVDLASGAIGEDATVDAYVGHFVQEIEAEPLHAFGRRYQEESGRRHWGVQTDTLSPHKPGGN